VLAAGALLFFGALLLQRQRSSFLALEADGGLAAQVAGESGLTSAEVRALRDLAFVYRPGAVLGEVCRTFVRERAHLGDALAAVALCGDRAAAEAARRAAPDAATAWQRFQTTAEAVPGLRFLAMRDRFAARERPRD
jgi:hypothetical protein